MPAALVGAGGKLQGAGWRVWAANSVLHAPTALGLKPLAQAACNDFNKKTIDSDRVYQAGFADLITLDRYHASGST